MNQTVISAENQSLKDYLATVFAHRWLLFYLVRRDLRIKYAQTFLGWLWVIFQPLAGVAIYTFFFKYIVRLDTEGVPYPIIALTGLTSWNYFSFQLNQGGNAIIASQELVSKVGFPRVLLVLSKSIIGLVDLGFTLLILLLFMLFSNLTIGPQIFLLPLVIGLNFLVALAPSLWVAALTIRHRDLHMAVPYIITFGIWFTPVFYPSSLIPEQLSFLNYLNPMAGVIELLRYCVYGQQAPHYFYLAGAFVALFVFATGLLVFKNRERTIGDYF